MSNKDNSHNWQSEGLKCLIYNLQACIVTCTTDYRQLSEINEKNSGVSSLPVPSASYAGYNENSLFGIFVCMHCRQSAKRR